MPPPSGPLLPRALSRCTCHSPRLTSIEASAYTPSPMRVSRRRWPVCAVCSGRRRPFEPPQHRPSRRAVRAAHDIGANPSGGHQDSLDAGDRTGTFAPNLGTDPSVRAARVDRSWSRTEQRNDLELKHRRSRARAGPTDREGSSPTRARSIPARPTRGPSPPSAARDRDRRATPRHAPRSRPG
jgi:hypothetical protein